MRPTRPGARHRRDAARLFSRGRGRLLVLFFVAGSITVAAHAAGGQPADVGRGWTGGLTPDVESSQLAGDEAPALSDSGSVELGEEARAPETGAAGQAAPGESGAARVAEAQPGDTGQAGTPGSSGDGSSDDEGAEKDKPKGDKDKDKDKEPKKGDAPPAPDPLPAPGAPEDLVVLAAHLANELSWSAPSSGGTVTAYAISRRSGTETAFAEIAAVPASQTSYSDSVTMTGAAFYAVTATGEGGVSEAAGPAANDRVAMSLEVGPGGGTLTAANGELELVIPAGALAGATTVTVAERADAPDAPSTLLLADLYDFGPDGLTLALPATVRMRYEIGVAHFQIAATLEAALEVLTYDEAWGVWVAQPSSLVAGQEMLEGEVTHFSYWSGGVIQPHGTTPSKTSYCSGVCHVLSAAPGSPDVIPSRDPGVCYYCHGNVDSTMTPAGANGPNIEAQFYECDDQSFESTWSRHPVPTTTPSYIACTDCHDPHRDPTAGNEGLLRAYDAVTGRAVLSGDDYCLACHGTRASARIEAAVPGYYSRTGDKRSAWVGNAHRASIAATGATDSACMACHEMHGSTATGLVRLTINGRAVAANDTTVCYACHPTALRSYPGSSTYDAAAHGATSTACQGCHDPHGQAGVPSLLDALEEQDCYACHDGSVAGVPDIESEATKDLSNPLSWQRNDVWTDGTVSGMLRTEVGDIDGDSDLDFVTVWQDRTIRWHENLNGDGSAWSTVLIGTAPAGSSIRSLDAGDLEPDGDMDVLVAWLDTSGSPRDGGVDAYVNTSGDGSSWTERDVRTLTDTFGFDGRVLAHFGDLDDDGDLDVASGWWKSDIRWHENLAGDGTAWGDETVTVSFGLPYRLEVDDVTGDDSPDILNGSEDNRVRIYRNDNDATSWTYLGFVGTAGEVHDVETGDLDGDSDNDIVVTGWGDSARVYLNTLGDGTSWSGSVLPKYWGLANVAIALADLNGDLDLDVVISTGLQIYQYDNLQGDAGSWEGSYAFVGGDPDYGAYNDTDAGDLDGDGDQDLSFGGSLSGTGRKAFWLENLGILPPTSGSHPVGAFSGRHSADETLGAVGAGNRHAECVDCHAPHEAEPGAHTMGDSNLAGVLEGAHGLMVSYSAPWTPPTYYDDGGEIDVAEEYELCFRCHSSYTTGYTGMDKALLFNPQNAAMHPIVQRGKNLGIWDSAFTLGTPWNPTAGDDPDYGFSSPRMTCSDCHASDDDSSPRGPHGSKYPHILRAKVSTNALEFGGGQNDLCVICHDNWTYNTGDSSMAQPLPIPGGYSSRVYHRHFRYWGAYCLECHDVHGSNDPHMVHVEYSHLATGGSITEFSMCSIACHPGFDSTYTVTY